MTLAGQDQFDAPVDVAWSTTVASAVDSANHRDFGKAEVYLQMALREAEKFGPEGFRVGTTLNAMGLLYREERKYPEAENAFRKGLTILRKFYGTDGMDVGNVSLNLGSLLVTEGKIADAGPYLQKALVVYQGILGNNSLKASEAYCAIGEQQRLAKELDASEQSLKHCTDIREKIVGKSELLADAMRGMGLTFEAQGKLPQAEARLQIAEKMMAEKLAINHPKVVQVMLDHAGVLRKMGRTADAEKLETMANAGRRSDVAAQKK